MTSEEWVHEYEFEVGGKTLAVGSTFKVYGERGKTYRFIKAVTNPATGSTWIDCFGGSTSRQKSRSIDPEAINPTSIKKPKKKVE